MKGLSTSTTTTRRVLVIFASVLFVFLSVSAFLTGLYHLFHIILCPPLIVLNLFLLWLSCYTYPLPLFVYLSFVFFYYFICFSIIVLLVLYLLCPFCAAYRNKDVILILVLFYIIHCLA